MMGVFNNLVMFDQHVPQNSFESIVPDLATSWSWNEDGTELTFTLRHGVKWHDGKPFTAARREMHLGSADRQRGAESCASTRANPGTAISMRSPPSGDYEVTFHLKRPQPSLLALLASGSSPVYPCHVPPAQMRTHPIGTGPFKFVEFKPNESIKLVRNPDYWKKDRPYLDGIEYTIIPNPATQVLAFIAGKFDMSFPYAVTIPLLKDLQSQAPQALCDLTLDNGSRDVIVNRDEAALRQPRPAAGDGAGARPPGLHRHPDRGQGRHRRGDAAAAGRPLGHAGATC